MIVFESRKVRRIIGRLERGERIPAALKKLADEKKITTAWFSALGAFEWVELVEYDQEKKVYKTPRRFERECEILSLVGNLSFKDGAPFAHIHATLSRDTDNGVEVIGGHLVDGQVFACEIFLDCLDDLGLGRQLDEATGLGLWAGYSIPTDQPREALPPRELPQPRVSMPEAPREKEVPSAWAQAAAASDRREKHEERAPRRPISSPAPDYVPDPIPDRKRASDDDIFEEPVLEVGDYLDHKQFGICRVEGEDSEGAMVIRLPNGARKAMRLDVMQIQPPRFEGDKRIYPLVPRKK